MDDAAAIQLMRKLAEEQARTLGMVEQVREETSALRADVRETRADVRRIDEHIKESLARRIDRTDQDIAAVSVEVRRLDRDVSQLRAQSAAQGAQTSSGAKVGMAVVSTIIALVAAIAAIAALMQQGGCS